MHSSDLGLLLILISFLRFIHAHLEAVILFSSWLHNILLHECITAYPLPRRGQCASFRGRQPPALDTPERASHVCTTIAQSCTPKNVKSYRIKTTRLIMSCQGVFQRR